MSGYDPETFEYVGPCPDCDGDHGDAGGPETLGGRLACLEAQAMAHNIPAVTAAVDQVRAHVASMRNSALARLIRDQP